MAWKRKLQISIRKLLMLTILFAVFALGYRTGHREHLKSSEERFANFDELIRLIEKTTPPDTWDALGGPETMEPYPPNLSLIISGGIIVHDQDADIGDEP